MRKVISTAAIVMVAAFVRYDGISYSHLAAQDRVAGIVSARAQSAGVVRTRSRGPQGASPLKGPFRRSDGGRDMEGTLTVTLARPDKMKRVEEMQMGGMVGVPTIERTSVLAARPRGTTRTTAAAWAAACRS
jgi:hypothetical protein